MQEDWFTRLKFLINTSDALNNKNTYSQAVQMCSNKLLAFGYDYHQRFAPGIDAVTIQQLRAVAARRLHNCLVAVSTPDPDSVNIKSGVRTYASSPAVDLTPRGMQHSTGVLKP